MELMLDGRQVRLKHLEKQYIGSLTKADIIDYYIRIAPYLLPHLKGRAFSMIFFPEGKIENSFYQKQCPSDAPEWMTTARIDSKRRGYIDWCVVDNVASLIYMVNKSVIEMHAWFSKIDNLGNPDMAVIDIDPGQDTKFINAVKVARCYKTIFDGYKLKSYVKTSGNKGLHIFIPIEPKYSYAKVQEFLRHTSGLVEHTLADIATTERLKVKRGDKVYLDAVQCNMGKTLAMPYSLRVKSGGCVSTPLLWDEVDARLDPAAFDTKTIFDRLEQKGDLFRLFYNDRQSLPVFN